MGTTIKTWVFNSNAESFIFIPHSYTTGGYTSDVGNPSGSLLTALAVKGKREDVLYKLSGVSWEDLGVPSGATITHIQFTNIDTYVGVDGWNNAGYASTEFNIFAAEYPYSNVVGNTLFTRKNITVQDSSWQSGSGSQFAVLSAYQASDTLLDIEIFIDLKTSSIDPCHCDIGIDNVELTITYTGGDIPVNGEETFCISSVDTGNVSVDYLISGIGTAVEPVADAGSVDVNYSVDGIETTVIPTITTGTVAPVYSIDGIETSGNTIINTGSVGLNMDFAIGGVETLITPIINTGSIDVNYLIDGNETEVTTIANIGAAPLHFNIAGAEVFSTTSINTGTVAVRYEIYGSKINVLCSVDTGSIIPEYVIRGKAISVNSSVGIGSIDPNNSEYKEAFEFNSLITIELTINSPIGG